MRKIVKRFRAYGMQCDIYEDGGCRCLTVEDGGKINMKELTLNDRINDRIERNKYYQTAVVTNDNVRKEFDKNNYMLSELAEYIKTHVDVEYNRGLNDAWELARKIACKWPIGYSIEELDDIFGNERIGTATTMENHTYQEALAKVEAYEKKKAEEEAKLEPGDVVEYFTITTRATAPKSIGIFLHEDLITESYWVLPSYGGCPQKLSKDLFKFRKTGDREDFKYVNIGGSDD